MSAETTIVTAIHNIKSNHGSDTPGVDNKTMRREYLQKPYRWVINDIQRAFEKFEAQKIRRKYIDKPGKKEKRPLGIPTIRDRIVQECMRIVLEPIVEALFFEHSYGFRPMRDTAMALERLNFITFHTGYYWFVEGDISKCFDYIDHAILLRRLKRKVDVIADNIKKIPRDTSREKLIDEINRINSQIRGVIQYYQCCTWVSVSMDKYGRKIQLAASRRLKQYKGKWIRAQDTQNLPRIHQNYRQKIPSVKYRDIYVGVTSLTFCNWQETRGKNPKETPYTAEGREINFRRTKKKRIQARLDDVYSENASIAVLKGKWGYLNNFEFVMNKAYALNRDRLKCRVCGKWLIDHAPYTHRINPYLPLDKVNRVNNLISVHKKCSMAINTPGMDISDYEKQVQKKILSYREKLVVSHTRNN